MAVINVNLCVTVTSMDCVVNLVNQIAFILKGIRFVSCFGKTLCWHFLDGN